LSSEAPPQDPQETSALARARGLVVRHPIIVGVLVGCTFLGVAIGLAVLPGEWSLLRRIAGGAVGGAGCGLIFTAPRIIG